MMEYLLQIKCFRTSKIHYEHYRCLFCLFGKKFVFIFKVKNVNQNVNNSKFNNYTFTSLQNLLITIMQLILSPVIKKVN